MQFFRKKFRRQHSPLSGLSPPRGRFWPLVFEKIAILLSPFFENPWRQSPLSLIFSFFRQMLSKNLNFVGKIMKNRIRQQMSLSGLLPGRVAIWPLFLKKAEIFSGAASEGYGSNPTWQPFFRVSEVSDLTAFLRMDSAEVFTP